VEGSGRGLILKYYSGICLEGLTKTTKYLSQYSRSLGRDLCETGPLTGSFSISYMIHG
jgi:hypothetical protein